MNLDYNLVIGGIGILIFLILLYRHLFSKKSESTALGFQDPNSGTTITNKRTGNSPLSRNKGEL
ncbi:hypothetical protein ACFLRF_01775 [Candidatus Altiarchaeota archaeon]